MIGYFVFHKRQRQITYRQKRRVFDKPKKEIYIGKKSSIFIFGAEGSGKTKKLNSLIEQRDIVDRKREHIFIKSSDSLLEIFQKNLNIELKGLQQYERIALLVEQSKNAVIYVDDLDKLRGKKLEILKDIVKNCYRIIATAQDEQAINRTIRDTIRRRKLKKIDIDLKSKTSRDATNLLFGVFIILLFVLGSYEAAILVMGARMLSRGSK